MNIESANCHGSSTTAKTALGLSIGALGALLLGAGGGNILSGLLGRPASDTVTPAILQMIVALLPTLRGMGCSNDRCDQLEAENAKLKAEMYANEVGINTFKESDAALDKAQAANGAKFEKIFDELVENRVNTARTEERLKCLELRLTSKIDAGDQALANAIATESERRANGDNQLRGYVDCNFVPWKRVLDSSLLCPPVQLAATAGGASNAAPSNVVVSGTVQTQAVTP